MNNEFIQVQKLTVEDYSISSHNLTKLTIFSNIETIGQSLEIIFNDVTDLETKLPIKGGETIDMILTDIHRNKYKKTFILTKFLDISNDSEYSQIKKIQAISKDAYYLGVKRDYNSYNKTVSEIIKNYGSFKDSNPLLIKESIIIPGFTYTKAIQYMIDNFTKAHICFENNTGFVFSNIEDLLVQATDEYVFDYDIESYRYAVLEYNDIKSFDTILEGYNNIYKNTYTTFNPNTKAIESVNKTVQDELENVTLGTGTNYSAEIYDNINTKNNILPYSTNRLQTSNKYYNMFNKPKELLLNGDLNIQIGTVIKVGFIERLTNKNDNRLIAGEYLVTKVAHHMTNEDFFTKIEVQKNNYFK